MQSTKLLFIVYLSLFVGCKKDNSDEWVVQSSGSHQYYDHLVFIEDKDYIEKVNIEFRAGSLNVLWGESHVLYGNLFRKDFYKHFALEIQDSTSITEFFYQNTEIRDSLKGNVVHSFNFSRDNGTYRIINGYMSGKKIN